MNNYKITKTTSSLLKYHFVFCTRRRRKIFNIEGVENSTKKIITDICKELNIEVITIICNVDYVYLLLNAIPELSPSYIIFKIKESSSKILRNEFLEFSKMSSLWTRNFLVSSSDNITNEVIESYVNEQKMRT